MSTNQISNQHNKYQHHHYCVSIKIDQTLMNTFQ